jgi:hypothetical protein
VAVLVALNSALFLVTRVPAIDSRSLVDKEKYTCDRSSCKDIIVVTTSLAITSGCM